MSKKVEGLSPKEFLKRFSRKKEPRQDKYISEKEWYPSKAHTLDNDIIKFALSNHLDSEGFIDYFKQNINPILEQKLEAQRLERQKTQKEFEEKKCVEALPENYIVARFFGKRAYPKQFKEVTQKYSLEDFRKLRTLVLEGRLNDKLGNRKSEFLTWINAVISEHPEPNEIDDTPSLLRKTINVFRGH